MFEVSIVAKLIVAALLGALIGYEREQVKKSAGLRTHMLVCLASCVLIITSITVFPTDSARIIAGIITGMGFIGAGAIIAGRGKIRGVTTAASIWLIAIIGIIVGLGLYTTAITTTIIAFLILELWRFEKKKS